MSDDRFKAWLTFWQFVLGTVVLGVFSTVISHQIQTREVEIKEQEANAKFLEQALQEDVGVRRRLSQYFAHVTRSAELRERWTTYAVLIDKEYQDTLQEKQNLLKAAQAKGLDASEKDILISRVADLERQLSPRPILVDTVPARLYIHIGSDTQRAGAESTAQVLRADAVVVPGIELRSNVPKGSELRYFRATERSEAEGIAATVRKVWPDVNARYVPGFEQSSGIRSRHYELWLSKQSKSQ